MAANVPLGIWREHTQKFSLSWFIAVHAAVPFIAMLRKSVLMPKTAMAFTIAASILGQVVGSRAERFRLAQAQIGHVGSTGDGGRTHGQGCIDGVVVGSCLGKVEGVIHLPLNHLVCVFESEMVKMNFWIGEFVP